jgi:hypothetical protein
MSGPVRIPGHCSSTVVYIVKTILVCDSCRAKTPLDGEQVTHVQRVMTFSLVHKAHTGPTGFSLLPLAGAGSEHSTTLLPAGVTPRSLLGPAAGLTVHAALADMSSLCGQAAKGALLRRMDLSWIDIPGDERCEVCESLT